MPIGTLTNRTHSQPAHSVSMPPSRTPAAPPEPATAPHTPMARLRSAPSSKSTVTSERAAGDSSAAPRPWTARAEISHTSFWARPPAREAPANRMRPAMNIRRRPIRSAMRPPSSRKPPKVSVYALTTHDRLSWEKTRALRMDGRATLTMEASSTTTNCAAASRTSASQRRSGEVLKACAPGEIEGKWKRSSAFTSQDTELTFRLSSPTLELMTKVVHRPLRADARRNRERVLSAAREVFGEQGREAQMDDVARRAAVGVGTVYRHFPTKEALLEALAVDAFERIVARAVACLEIADPWEALTSTLWAGAEILAADRALAEAMADIPGPVPIALETQLELTQTMTTLVERAKASGDLRPDIMLDDIPMLMCGMGAATRKSHQCPGAWRRHMTIIIDGLRASSASGPLPS